MWSRQLRYAMPDGPFCSLRTASLKARYLEIFYPLRIDMHFAMMRAAQSFNQFYDSPLRATAFIEIG